MNERFESQLPLEPRVIDRLVDGELTAAEESRLLEALDFQPDGWRRCALAFLEARVWKDEFATVTRREIARINGTSVVLASSAVDNASERLVPARTGQWARTLAIAASIALAFALGIFARGHWIDSDGPADSQIAASGREHAFAAGGMGAPDTGLSNPGGFQPTVTMTLVDDRGDVERELEIPVVETEGLDPRWFKRPPSAIPQHVVNLLRRSGHTVREQRLFVPVLLDDGRQAIIPLDQAEVRYEGAHF